MALPPNCTVRDELQQGETYRWVQPLQDMIDAGDFPNGLVGIVAYGVVVNPDRENVHRFASKPLQVGDTEVEFVMGGTVSENWEIGSWYLMQILFSDGTDTGKVISRTINIKIKEGFARLPSTGIGRGSFDASDFADEDFNTGAGGTI